ncbi:MAG: hypothetical protein NC204_07310 [Candidatus Amulumruptor caecigallinarius]|nr:hypothetical protein [Candidatus Amulumruptor caecigallinarius]
MQNDNNDKYKARYRSEGDVPRGKLLAGNWLEGISGSGDFPMVEVSFKNTRVGFYLNELNLPLKIGDIVAVEGNPGHDIGRVSMVGRLVKLQMKKSGFKEEPEPKKVYRIATPADLEKFEMARNREHDTMIRSRRIAEELGLNMKIGDVEYQGDGAKAIFYYIADERVDFRKLIRILADTFKIRVEMKQIGARQEAGRIGGIGPCGRPLCCSSWMTHFVSVGTGSARIQDLSMNPQKLAGQCAKLKCCLNFEIDAYSESQRKLPPRDVTLQTKDAEYFYFKPDILARRVTYSTDKKIPANLVTISAARAFEIIALNKRGEKPDTLAEEADEASRDAKPVDLLEQESLTRFDKSKKKKRNSGKSPDKGNRPDKNQRPDKGSKPDKGNRPEKGSRPGKENYSNNGGKPGKGGEHRERDRKKQPKKEE